MGHVMTDTIRPTLARRLLAEALGTGRLVAIVVGSGIAASRLSSDAGLQLLENSLATTLGLAVLIAVLGPVSGAHFNPLVTVAEWVHARRDGRPHIVRDIATYSGAQIVGGIAGALLANAMFAEPLAIATTDRATLPHLLGETVATAGLILVIFGLVRSGRHAFVAPAVGAYIGAAYWFTSSTSFANPAVTIGRVFSDTFAGIAPLSALAFIAAQIVGAAVGILLTTILFPRPAGSDPHKKG